MTYFLEGIGLITLIWIVVKLAMLGWEIYDLEMDEKYPLTDEFMTPQLKSSLNRFLKSALASFVSSMLLFVASNTNELVTWQAYLASALIAGLTGLAMFVEKFANWTPEETQP